MTTEVIRQKVTEIINEIFRDREYNIENVNQIDIINDLGLDSITFILVVVEIETHFNIEIPDEMLLPENFRCIDNIVSIVKMGTD